ncbi:hypothetical protein C8R46DRAFT_1056727, partial [Mycena filopes]
MVVGERARLPTSRHPVVLHFFFVASFGQLTFSRYPRTTSDITAHYLVALRRLDVSNTDRPPSSPSPSSPSSPTSPTSPHTATRSTS